MNSKLKLSIPFLGDTYDFILSSDMITHVTKTDDSCNRTELLFEQCPEQVKKKLNKLIQEIESEQNDTN